MWLAYRRAVYVEEWFLYRMFNKRGYAGICLLGLPGAERVRNQ